nr:hypothetical protein [Treponema sp.]
YGGNWFDVLKPGYYNFKNFKYKLYLHSLMIEQNNLYYVIPKANHYDADVSMLFQNGIKIKNDEPTLIQNWIEDYLTFNDVLIIKKEKLRNLIIEEVSLPSTCQYQFTVLGNTLVFADGIMIDLTPYLIDNSAVLKESSSFNPNITFDLKLEQKVRLEAAESKLLAGRDVYRRLAINGEESNTIMKFIEKSFLGQLRIFDYERDGKGLVVLGEKKTCLILYNGTKFPDLVCIFAEDAEKTEGKGNRTWTEYASYIWQEYERFAHHMFFVEAEFNLSSFKSHDISAEYVMKSKYIFCEYRSSEYYVSKYGPHIPAVSIRDL